MTPEERAARADKLCQAIGMGTSWRDDPHAPDGEPAIIVSARLQCDTRVTDAVLGAVATGFATMLRNSMAYKLHTAIDGAGPKASEWERMARWLAGYADAELDGDPTARAALALRLFGTVNAPGIVATRLMRFAAPLV